MAKSFNDGFLKPKADSGRGISLPFIKEKVLVRTSMYGNVSAGNLITKELYNSSPPALSGVFVKWLRQYLTKFSLCASLNNHYGYSKFDLIHQSTFVEASGLNRIRLMYSGRNSSTFLANAYLLTVPANGSVPSAVSIALAASAGNASTVHNSYVIAIDSLRSLHMCYNSSQYVYNAQVVKIASETDTTLSIGSSIQVGYKISGNDYAIGLAKDTSGIFWFLWVEGSGTINAYPLTVTNDTVSVGSATVLTPVTPATSSNGYYSQQPIELAPGLYGVVSSFNNSDYFWVFTCVGGVITARANEWILANEWTASMKSKKPFSIDLVRRNDASIYRYTVNPNTYAITSKALTTNAAISEGTYIAAAEDSSTGNIFIQLQQTMPNVYVDPQNDSTHIKGTPAAPGLTSYQGFSSYAFYADGATYKKMFYFDDLPNNLVYVCCVFNIIKASLCEFAPPEAIAISGADTNLIAVDALRLDRFTKY